jgi:hypothetical protein
MEEVVINREGKADCNERRVKKKKKKRKRRRNIAVYLHHGHPLTGSAWLIC